MMVAPAGASTRGRYPDGFAPTAPAAARAVLGGCPVELLGPLASGSERGREVAASWADADAHRRRLVDVLSRAAVADATIEDGRATVHAVKLGDGLMGRTVHVDGRELREDWAADPQRTARAMERCGMGGGIHKTKDGWGAHAYGCTGPMCPSCMRRSAATRKARWLPVITWLAFHGCQVLHVTVTQRQELAKGAAVLTDDEARWYAHEQVRDGVATPGETLGGAIERVRAAWRLMKDGAESRAWWRRTVLADLSGVEWTGSTRRADGRHLRWHAHQHVLVVLRPGVRVEWEEDDSGRWLDAGRCPWWSRFVGRWCEVADAGALGQRARVIGSEGPDELGRAVAEVLKYPFKPAHLTDAQVMEVLATTKGCRFHLPGGAFHQASRIGKAAFQLLDGQVDALDKLGTVDAAHAELVSRALRHAEEEEEGADARVLYRHPSALDASATDARSKAMAMEGPDGHDLYPVTVRELARAVLEEDVPLFVGYLRGADGEWEAGELCPMDVLAGVLTWTEVERGAPGAPPACRPGEPSPPPTAGRRPAPPRARPRPG